MAEDDAVVLVGRERLLQPALATERDPAQPDPAQRMLRKLEFEHALGEAVVERGDKLGEMLGGNAVGEHVPRELPDFTRRLLQRCRVLRRGDRFRQLAQGDPLHRKQVALRHHADHPAFLDHWHMASAVLGHG